MAIFIQYYPEKQGRSGSTGIDGIRFQPGRNQFSDEIGVNLKINPIFKTWIEKGIVAIAGENIKETQEKGIDVVALTVSALESMVLTEKSLVTLEEWQKTISNTSSKDKAQKMTAIANQITAVKSNIV